MKTYLFLFSLLASHPLHAAEAPKAKEVILDVRSDSEFAESHLDGAKHMNVNAAGFRELAAKMDKSATYRLYCKSGGRAGRAADILKELGFTKVENLGGIQEASKKTKISCVPKGC